MPQSSGSSPSAISRRSAMIFSTRGCSLKLGGTSAILSPSCFNVSSGSRVSSFSFHWVPMKTASSRLRTAACSSTGSSCWCGNPRRARSRYVATISSASASVMTPFASELVGIHLARASDAGDALVHQRLRDHRLVLLVVAEPAIADQVDHHVFAGTSSGSRARFR